MKKLLFLGISLLLTTTILSGCNAVGDKVESLSIIYGATTALSLLLLIGCIFLVRKKKTWFVLLFSSVFVVNVGYTHLSVSTCLKMALVANSIAYSGSVFLPMAMMMIILNVTNTRYKKFIPISLTVLSVVMFLITASPGILPIYYKEVSFAVVNGVSTLVKVYGPLHPLYLFYLIGYFIAMVAIIIRASVKKSFDATSHAVILAIAVLVNIGVWFIEQLSDINFEMLSISYIISELFLLGIHLVMNENQRLRELVMQKEEALKATNTTEAPAKIGIISQEAMKYFTRGVDTLTPTERSIYEAYLVGSSTKQILSEMNIKENTLKFHNKNIYGKLGVSSRKQLLEVYRAINAQMKEDENA